jgi:hypothetical protein
MTSQIVERGPNYHYLQKRPSHYGPGMTEGAAQVRQKPVLVLPKT